MNQPKLTAILTAISITILFLLPVSVSSHCDTYSGPVIIEAKKALEKGDVTPLLKWVKKEDEEQIKGAFKKTVAVRGKGADVKEIADQYFFETLVRIHRAAEGFPFTGLKNTPVEPIEAKADSALETGSIDSLANKMAAHVKEGVKEHFAKALEAKKNADKSVEAGRKYVEAYISYLHYVIGIHSAVMGEGGHHHEGEAGEEGSAKKHKE